MLNFAGDAPLAAQRRTGNVAHIDLPVVARHHLPRQPRAVRAQRGGVDPQRCAQDRRLQAGGRTDHQHALVPIARHVRERSAVCGQRRRRAGDHGHAPGRQIRQPEGGRRTRRTGRAPGLAGAPQRAYRRHGVDEHRAGRVHQGRALQAGGIDRKRRPIRRLRDLVDVGARVVVVLRSEEVQRAAVARKNQRRFHHHRRQ